MAVAVEMRRDHLRLDRSFVTVRGSTVSIFVVVIVAAVEIVRAFMFAWAAMLFFVLVSLPLSDLGNGE